MESEYKLGRSYIEDGIWADVFAESLLQSSLERRTVEFQMEGQNVTGFAFKLEEGAIIVTDEFIAEAEEISGLQLRKSDKIVWRIQRSLD